MHVIREAVSPPNSAAIPLPTLVSSAAGRHPQAVTKLLIYKGFLTPIGCFLGAETGFSPADRGKCTHVRGPCRYFGAAGATALGRASSETTMMACRLVVCGRLGPAREITPIRRLGRLDCHGGDIVVGLLVEGGAEEALGSQVSLGAQDPGKLAFRQCLEEAVAA